MISSEARGAWNELEARLRPYVARRVASAADVDDILQNIFVRMHGGLSALQDGERFGGWVYKIAERVIIDSARVRTREPLIAVAELPERPELDAPEDSEELQAALGECVALFVARLPSPYREAITLTELEGLTQSEAADMLGLSLSGMKSRVQRGREKIREMFEECCRISLDCRGRVVACEPRSLEEIPSDCRDAAKSWGKRRCR
ncbi:MAG TPA: RNA polymerase sigma factor SigZ [Polyangiaceae bacterium]|nr:RNA polymerase sigma factor SigZ [Polyangiaceae bacterium]